MPDWTSPAELQRAAAFRTAMGLVLFGIVIWEILTTLPFDFSIVSGRRKFKWPMALYFVARISMLLHALGLIINSHGNLVIECNDVTWVLKSDSVTDATGIWSSSGLLILRTLAVWSHDKRIVVGAMIMFIGLVVCYGLTWQLSNAFWDGKQCQFTRTAPNEILLAEFLYTFAFDLVVTVFATIKLWQWRGQSGVSEILLRDGIAYFIFASCGNLLQAVFPSLHLNPIWNITFLPVAMSISVIAATRVFSNLINAHDALIDPATVDLMSNVRGSRLGSWRVGGMVTGTSATDVESGNGIYFVPGSSVARSTLAESKTEQTIDEMDFGPPSAPRKPKSRSRQAWDESLRNFTPT